MITRLYVLYDASCGLCSRVREWAQQQPQFVPLEFIPFGSRRAAQMFPALQRECAKPEELLVIDDQGGIYHEGDAWLMCLWALVEYRQWAARLSGPMLLPLARQAFAMLSQGRSGVSAMLGYMSDEELAATLTNGSTVKCEPGSPKTLRIASAAFHD
jgi:predicted DCC family thiol-disulfide oxidoreductase YuxK